MLNYTDLAAKVIGDVAGRLSGFSHLDPRRIAVVAAPRWAGTCYGNLASCTGLRGRHDPTFTVWVRRGSRNVLGVSPWHRIRPTEVWFNGVKCNYLIMLRMPRCLEHDPLETLIHELYHIAEEFDGGIRPLRHGDVFDQRVRQLMREWLRKADPGLSSLARMNFDQIRKRHGSLYARSLPRLFRPTLVEPVDSPESYEEGVARLYPNLKLSASYRVRQIEFPADDIPRRITERDCALRVYHAGGAETLAPGCERYIKSSLASEAF